MRNSASVKKHNSGILFGIVGLVLTLIFLASCGRARLVGPEKFVFIRNDTNIVFNVDDIEILPRTLPSTENFEGAFQIPTNVIAADTSIPPHNLVGRLNLFNITPDGVSGSWCSATLIAGTNVAVTAAHCLYSNPEGWVDDMEFVLRFGGNAPRTYDWRCAAVKNVWVNSNPGDFISRQQSSYDIAFVLLNQSEVSSLSPTESGLPNEVTISGYPSKHFGGTRMVTGTTELGASQGGALITFIDMNGGSSGSSWINGNNIHGVISAGNDSTGLIVGAPVDGFAKRLEDFVTRDCPPEEGVQSSAYLGHDAKLIRNALLEKINNSGEAKVSSINSEVKSEMPISLNPVTANISLAKVQLSPRIQLVSNKPGLSCTFQCDQQSPLCNSVPVPFDYGPEVNRVANLFREKRNILKSEMMSIFDQEEDGCNRTDITISGNRFQNSGNSDSCVASSKYNVSSNNNPQYVTLDVAIPKQVSGDVTSSDGEIGVKFDIGSEPGFLFNDDPNSIYSGFLSEITTHKNALVATIGGACLFMAE